MLLSLAARLALSMMAAESEYGSCVVQGLGADNAVYNNCLACPAPLQRDVITVTMPWAIASRFVVVRPCPRLSLKEYLKAIRLLCVSGAAGWPKVS